MTTQTFALGQAARVVNEASTHLEKNRAAEQL
jgi:hypothetical protein